MKKVSVTALASASVASAAIAVAVTAFVLLKNKNSGTPMADNAASGMVSPYGQGAFNGHSPAGDGAATSMGASSLEGSTLLASGTIEVAPALLDRSKQIGILFVMLRSSAGGPPYAVVRLENPRTGEPIPFELTGENVMAQGVPLPSDARVVVRFDADGSAGPEAPGDLVGEVAVSAPGTSGLKVMVDRAGGMPSAPAP